LSETYNHLIDALDWNYINTEQLNAFKIKIDETERLLNGYIAYLRKNCRIMNASENISTSQPLNLYKAQPVNHSTDQLINYSLHLADNTLILAQRNSEWCGHGPVLEQDIAITNISLDILGQARNFYQYAAELISQSTHQLINLSTDQPVNSTANPITEDTLAYLRDSRDFKNCLLVEQPNGDWGKTILRQFLFSNYQYLLYQKLQDSNDERLAAIAEKALKEVTYHLRWSSEWVVRLGDGTEESHQRMINAVSELWPYVEELFINADFETALLNDDITVDVASLRQQWNEKTGEVFSEAKLEMPQNVFAQKGGKQGIHIEKLGYILAELQFMQRAYPNSVW
jgi:ring-1,2-phenylacetyl-CoA epoxidase subunit PaaC